MLDDWTEVCCGGCGAVWDARTPHGAIPTDCPFCGEDGAVTVIEEDGYWPPSASRYTPFDDAAIVQED